MADWQPGDLALCIKQGKWDLIRGEFGETAHLGPKAGDSCSVVDVDVDDDGSVWLFLAEWDADDYGSFDAVRFVKVTPGADIEGIEAEKRLTGKVGQDA